MTMGIVPFILGSLSYRLAGILFLFSFSEIAELWGLYPAGGILRVIADFSRSVDLLEFTSEGRVGELFLSFFIFFDDGVDSEVVG